MNKSFAIAVGAAALLASAALAENPTRGTVTGVVLDGQGKPIEGARIWVKPSLTTGLVETRTGEDGRYRASGLINIPYNTYAWTKMTYRDKTVCMRVAPASLTQYDSFVPTDGVVRNFKLRTSGPIDDRGDIYYGGDLRIFYQEIPRDATIEVKFEPLGPLVDGSVGNVVVRQPKDMMIQDIPVGAFRVTAQVTDVSGRKRQGRLSRKNFDNNPTPEVTVDWESKDSCIGSFGNGLDRQYLYIR
jgi:hypothetical protein